MYLLILKHDKAESRPGSYLAVIQVNWQATYEFVIGTRGVMHGRPPEGLGSSFSQIYQ